VTFVQCSPRLMGETLCRSQVFFEWREWRKQSREKVEDVERSGRPRSHRTEKKKKY